MPSSAPYGFDESFDGRQTIQLGFDLESDDGSAFPFSAYDIRFYARTGCYGGFVGSAGNGIVIDTDASTISILIPARTLRCDAHNIELVLTEIATGIVSVLVDGTILIDGDY